MRLRRFSSADGRRALRLAPRTAEREKTALLPPHPGREETAIVSSFIVNYQTPHFCTGEALLMYEMLVRDAIGTGEALLVYGRSLRGTGKHTRRVFLGGLLGRCDYFLRTFPTRRDFAAPSPGRAGFLRAGSKKTGRPGFLRSGCASAGLRIGPGGLAGPGKPTHHSRGKIAVPGKDHLTRENTSRAQVCVRTRCSSGRCMG